LYDGRREGGSKKGNKIEGLCTIARRVVAKGFPGVIKKRREGKRAQNGLVSGGTREGRRGSARKGI